MSTTIELESACRATALDEAGMLAALLELATLASSKPGATAACQALARQGREFSGCQLVAVATVSPSGRCRLRATSGQSEIDTAAGFSRLLQDALDEGWLQNGVIRWPPGEAPGPLTATAHAALGRQLPATSLVSGPLRNRKGRITGVWLFAFDEFDRRMENLEAWVETAIEPLGTALDLVTQAAEGPLARVARRACGLARPWWVGAGSVAAVASALLLAQRVAYRVSADCELQPQTRRFIAAPFDGQLDTSLVKQGDLVETDQPLARMDGRSLRVELAGTAAEFDRARKEQDVNLAAGKVAQAQMAMLECERFEHKRQLLAQRIEHLELRSPLAGVVLSGDLQRSEGAPVTLGQGLFEVAPLDRMICEIAVAEEDVAHVRPGQPVAIRLEAFPGQVWSGKLESIHPRSEIRDRQNIFVAEVAIENPQRQLRPGMKGSATIETSPQSRGWIWFHKPLAKAARLLEW